MNENTENKAKGILKVFLHDRMKREQIFIKSLQCYTKIIGIQNKMRVHSDNKKNDLNQIKMAMEVSRKAINKAIMDNKNARKFYDWLLKELCEINK